MAFGLCLSLAGWLPVSGGIAVMLGAHVIAVALALLGLFFLGLTVWLYRREPDVPIEPQDLDLGFGRFGRR